MARQVLPINFQDDVLSTSMNGKRRYRLLQQSDGAYILEDVTTYDTVGSTFGASQINQTNQAVNQSADKDDVLVTMEEIEANTDNKKIAGANTVKQLSSELYTPVSGTGAMSIAQAVTHICENFVGRQRSARGRFACPDFIGGFDIISDESGNCSGTIVSESEALSYSFFRRAGADAVLKKLGDVSEQMNGVVFMAFCEFDTYLQTSNIDYIQINSDGNYTVLAPGNYTITVVTVASGGNGAWTHVDINGSRVIDIGNGQSVTRTYQFEASQGDIITYQNGSSHQDLGHVAGSAMTIALSS